MSAVVPDIASYASPNPKPLPVHTDASQYPYPHGIGELQDRSEFELVGAAAPVSGMISETTDSAAYDYGHVDLSMNEATNVVLLTTMQPGSNLPFHCEVCNITCNTKDVLDAHKRGKKHLKSAKKLAEPSANAPIFVTNETSLGELENKKLRLLKNGATFEALLLCEICNVICNNQDGFQQHIASKKHAAKSIVQQANPNAVFDAISASSCASQKNSCASQKKPDIFPCEICKITCTSHELLKLHIAGKKHIKKVKVLGQIPNLPLTPIASQDTPSMMPVVNPESSGDKTVNLPLIPAVSEDTPPTNNQESIEDKTVNLPLTPIASQDVSPIINPVVNDESIEGKTVNLPLTPTASQDVPPVMKPVINEQSIEVKSVNLDGATHIASQDTPPTMPVVNSEANEGKSVNLHGFKLFCELCGISCHTNDVLKAHLVGKKHRKKLEKSEGLIGPKPAIMTESAETATMTGAEGGMVNSSGRKRKGGGDEDVEAKKLRILQSGTATDAVQVCTLCSVVCNSSKAFIFHLGGQKHAAMAVKYAESQAAAIGQES